MTIFFIIIAFIVLFVLLGLLFWSLKPRKKRACFVDLADADSSDEMIEEVYQPVTVIEEVEEVEAPVTVIEEVVEVAPDPLAILNSMAIAETLIEESSAATPDPTPDVPTDNFVGGGGDSGGGGVSADMSAPSTPDTSYSSPDTSYSSPDTSYSAPDTSSYSSPDTSFNW
jgi:hypothetical protein